MSAKRILSVVVASALTAMLAACGAGGTAGDAKTLTVVMWGGSAQTAHVDSYFTPWAKDKGYTIRQDSPTDYAKIKAQVDSGKVTWGAVEAEPNFANNACTAGMLEKLPQSVIDAAKTAEVDDALMGECAIPVLQYAYNIGYNTETFKDDHPTTWAEFFDTKNFPGKRGFWKFATGGIFEAALLADGVAPEDLYPLDIDRAFKKLDTIKKDIVFYETGDQQAQLVSSGEAPLVQAWNGRIFTAAQAGEPVANEWGEHIATYDQLVIPKGYPNAKMAQDWMKWFLEHPRAQADDAIASSYGPPSPKALEFIPNNVSKELSTFPANAKESSILMDYGYWATNNDKVTERFNNWMAS